MSDQVYQRENFGDGQVIFKLGDAANSAYLIQAGAVNIVVQDGDQEVVVKTLAAGEIFGEMALVDGQPRSAAAVAKGGTTCVLISNSDFAKRVAKADPFVRAMLKLLSGRLRHATHRS